MICPYHARVDDVRPCVQVDRTTDRIRKRYSKPNPVHNMPDRNMPANHDTTTNPQNTNSPTHNDNQPPSDEPLKPPGSTDQIRNRNHKTNPVHNRPASRVPTDHDTTTNPQNTNNPTHNDNQPSSDEPLKPPESADQIGNRNHKPNPVRNRTTDHHQPAATVTSENHEFPTNRPHHHYHISSAQSPTLTEPRTKSENDTPNPIQSITDPTATRQPATILPQNRRIPTIP